MPGAARVSPHGLVQELLNASPDRLWGFASNGLQLRILRDNATITRQAYLEFDLEDMMEGEVYADFALLWLVAHQSRLEGQPPEPCWLERWSQLAIEQGTRALDRLRDGVEAAITALGRGFLSEPSNRGLRQRLERGELDREGYYRQLLRLVYRLIFLMVAEDRDLLHLPGTPARVRKIYADHYSAGRLRRLSERRRGTLHSDLYEALTLVMVALDKEGGLPALGLPALGSFLWRREAIADLADGHLRNRDLLAAVSALAFTTDGHSRRAVDYRNLGSEELGSVYKSLLELHPELNLAAATFTLATAGGHERKLTGSYYTPTSLITNLLDTALNPVLDAAGSAPDPETAIQKLKVVDPACGSGHFLIAAAHRIAKRLAAVRTAEVEPPPEAVRHALRDVIGNCIYGVDMNDMAVELCKVSLWMETLDPGRPLSFLDHRIILGDSLLGATPELEAQGIPDAAFERLDGDDAVTARSWQRRNRAERSGQMTIGFDAEAKAIRAVVHRATDLDAMPEDKLAAIIDKERQYLELLSSAEATRARMAADAWCAAFFTDKVPGAPEITEDLRHRLATDPGSANPSARSTVRGLADEFHFMHWHLAFPSVFGSPPDTETARASQPPASAGFDVVLGNPPWGQVELKETEWFATRAPDIAAATGARRKGLIAALQREDPSLWSQFRTAVRRSDVLNRFLHKSGMFPLCGQGRINTYAVFAETMRRVLAPRGRAGMILPPGIATDDTTKDYFRALVEGRHLVSLYDFENRGLFAAVHAQQKFCLLTICAKSQSPGSRARLFFNAHDVADLADDSRMLSLTPEEIALFNPNTVTCPVFRSRREAQILTTIYQHLPILVRHGLPNNPWQLELRQGLFNSTSASGLFRTRAQLLAAAWSPQGSRFYRNGKEYWPLMESKFFHILDAQWATFDGRHERDVTAAQRIDPDFVPATEYWVPREEIQAKLPGWDREWLAVIRKITNPMNERTAIPSLIPLCGVNDSAYLILPSPEQRHLTPLLVANMASLVFDFCTRNKLSGRNLLEFVLEQLPVLPPSAYSDTAPWT